MVFNSSFGVILHLAVFWAAVIGQGAYDRSTWTSMGAWSDLG